MIVKVEQTVVRDNEDIVFDILEKIGVESFEVSFDGGGDDGQISLPLCEPKALAKKFQQLLDEVVEGSRVHNGCIWINGAKKEEYLENATLGALIDSICYELLELACSGWEINEGSYGEFVFDVKNRTCSLDFNERVTTSRNSNYKFR